MLGALADQRRSARRPRGLDRRAAVPPRPPAARRRRRRCSPPTRTRSSRAASTASSASGLADDAVVICDGGDFASYAGKFVEVERAGLLARHRPVRLPRQRAWATRSPPGSRGRRARSCVLLGDGAAGFSLMDADSLVRHGLPVVMSSATTACGASRSTRCRRSTAGTWPATCSPGAATTRSCGPSAAPARLVDDPAEIGPALDRGFAAACRTSSTSLTDPADVYPRSLATSADRSVERRPTELICGSPGQVVVTRDQTHHRARSARNRSIVDDDSGDLAGGDEAAGVGRRHGERQAPALDPLEHRLGEHLLADRGRLEVVDLDAHPDRALTRWRRRPSSAASVASSHRATSRGVPSTATDPDSCATACRRRRRPSDASPRRPDLDVHRRLVDRISVRLADRGSEAVMAGTDVIEPRRAGDGCSALRCAPAAEFAEVFAEDKRSTSAGLDDGRIEQVTQRPRPRRRHPRRQGRHHRLRAHRRPQRGGPASPRPRPPRAAASQGGGGTRTIALTRRDRHGGSTPVERYPDDVPKADKVALLRRVDEAARGAAARRSCRCRAGYGDSRRRILVANTDGVLADDEQVRALDAHQRRRQRRHRHADRASRAPATPSASRCSTRSTSRSSPATRPARRSPSSTPARRRAARCPSSSSAAAAACCSTRRAVTASRPTSSPRAPASTAARRASWSPRRSSRSSTTAR